MESPEVSQFRQFILNGMWAKAEAALERLGVEKEEGLWVRGIPMDQSSPASLTFFMSGCKVLDKPAEIFGISGSQETDICIARPA
jgi:hypothetical protein